MAGLNTQASKAANLHDKFVRPHYHFSMSATEIINELPKLTEAELRSVRQRLLELAAQNEEIALCDQAAGEGAAMLDRMEEDDARRQRW
jgi:hypothetical protein